MRPAVLLASALLVAALSGCSGGSDPSGEGDGQRQSDGRRSVGGDGNGTEAPTEAVTFLDAAIDLVGVASQSFDVTVPANSTAVDVRIDSAPVGEYHSLRIDLPGCGTFDQGLGSYTGVPGTFQVRLCKQAQAGPATLTVSNNGFVQGQVRATARVPVQNATGSP